MVLGSVRAWRKWMKPRVAEIRSMEGTRVLGGRCCFGPTRTTVGEKWEKTCFRGWIGGGKSEKAGERC